MNLHRSFLRPGSFGFIIGVWCSVYLALPAAILSAASLERQIKAVYIYKLIKFVDWPQERSAPENSPFIVCVLGDTLLAKNLSELGTQNRDSNFKVIRLESDENIPFAHALFIGAGAGQYQENVIAAVKGKPVLVFGEEESFLKNYGMINFVLREGKIRFEINLKAIKNSGLELSSRALRAASKVLK